jgi:hypothetical protein
MHRQSNTDPFVQGERRASMKQAEIGWRDLALVYEQSGFHVTEFEMEYENTEWSMLGLDDLDEFLDRSGVPVGLDGEVELNDFAMYLANGLIVR